MVLQQQFLPMPGMIYGLDMVVEGPTNFIRKHVTFITIYTISRMLQASAPISYIVFSKIQKEIFGLAPLPEAYVITITKKINLQPLLYHMDCRTIRFILFWKTTKANFG